MSYQLYDADGYVGDLATTSGLKELREFLDEDGQHPRLSELVRDGSLELAAEIKAEILAEIRTIDAGADVASMLDNLAVLLRESEGIIIISDGLELDEDESE